MRYAAVTKTWYLSFGLIGLYRLNFYTYYFICIYTVHLKNIGQNKMFLTDSKPW